MADRDRMPKYLQRLIDGGWETSPGEDLEINVNHGPDCNKRRGGGCDCAPDIRLKPAGKPTPKE